MKSQGFCHAQPKIETRFDADMACMYFCAPGDGSGTSKCGECNYFNLGVSESITDGDVTILDKDLQPKTFAKRPGFS